MTNQNAVCRVVFNDKAGQFRTIYRPSASGQINKTARLRCCIIQRLDLIFILLLFLLFVVIDDKACVIEKKMTENNSCPVPIDVQVKFDD